MAELPPYSSLVAHYEACLARYGDSPRGVDWPDAEGARRRYEVMLDVTEDSRGEPVTLLDFGCGAAHLYDHIVHTGQQHRFRYTGLDLSEAFLDLCRAKHPHLDFLQLDVLDRPEALPDFDYCIMNGVFTERLTLSVDEMYDYMAAVLRAVYPKVGRGLAFNVMSAHVDWERDDLFHVPFDRMGGFVRHELSRHFVFRQDYGLHEYTTYVFRAPSADQSRLGVS